MGNPFTIQVQATDSSKIHYFITNSKSETVSSGNISPFVSYVNDNIYEIMITSEESSHLDVGANTLKIFASSDEALRPDSYTTSFLVVEGHTTLPDIPILQTESKTVEIPYMGILSIIIGAIIVGIIISIRRKRKKKRDG